jgi:hypothetical protein
MKFKIFTALSCLLLLLSACSHVYSPAMYHQDIAYQPKPTSFDKENSASYVSLGLGGYTNTNLNDGVVAGQFNISQGYVFDNFNVAYGGFGSVGDYQSGSTDTKSASYFSDRYFGALGARASINAFVHSDRADIRFIGMEMAYSHEFGDYASLRQNLQKIGGFYVDPRVDLFTIGLTSEVIFHNRNDNDFQHGIRGFLGTTVGHNNLDDTYYKDETSTTRMFHNIFPKASYFIKYKDYFGTIEAGSAIFVRFGYKF